MSLSPIVDERYRLHPADLGRGAVHVTIQNVSWQGVEERRLLLHLREFPRKRLVLDQHQLQTLIQLMGTTNEKQWIGQALQIVVQHAANEAIIALAPAGVMAEKPANYRRAFAVGEVGKTLLLLALLGLLFFFVFLLDR